MMLSTDLKWDTAEGNQRSRAPSISTDEVTSNPTPATQSHPHDRSLKTDTVDGCDMLDVVVGNIATGEYSMAISADGSDYVGPPQRRVGQTSRRDAEDGFEDMLDLNFDDTSTQTPVEHSEDRASEANTGSQRKRPREDDSTSTSRDVPCIDEFAGITNKIGELLFTLQGIQDTMVEKAKERERALRVSDPWDALKEIPGIDNTTRFKVLRMLSDESMRKSFIRMDPEERKNWIDFNLS